MTTTDTISDLWNAIEETPTDWGRWLILADAYADQGDEIGESYCRWIAEKERFGYHNGTGFVFHQTINQEYKSMYPNDKLNDSYIPKVLDWDVMIKNGRSGVWYYGTKTITQLHEVYLDAWRTLTDEQRAECFAWQP